jgi:hypothetical protein
VLLLLPVLVPLLLLVVIVAVVAYGGNPLLSPIYQEEPGRSHQD